MKKRVTIFFLIFLMLLTLTGCKTKSVPFFEKQNGKITKNYKQTFENPVYFYTLNKSNEMVELEGVEFVQNKAKITFSNWKMSKPDKEGYVILTYDTKIDVDIEIYAQKQKEKWYYTYVTNSPLLYDYNTGAIYKTNSVSSDGSRSYQNGTLVEAKEEFKYTNIKFNDKNVKVGIYNVSSARKYDGLQTLEKKDGKNHYKDHGSLTITTNIRIPKDYTGVVLVVNKKGSDKSFAVELNQKGKELKALEDKYGKDGKEVKELEKQSNKIRYLVDKNDEVRKKYTIDDYYNIKLADVFNIKEEPETNYIPLIIIISLIATLFITTIITILIIKKYSKKKKHSKKKNKE